MRKVTQVKDLEKESATEVGETIFVNENIPGIISHYSSKEDAIRHADIPTPSWYKYVAKEFKEVI